MIEYSWTAIVFASIYWGLSLAFSIIKPESPRVLQLKADAALALLVALVLTQIK